MSSLYHPRPPSDGHHGRGGRGVHAGEWRVRSTCVCQLEPARAAAPAYVDQKRVAAQMRQLAESQLDGSPNKGPKKKLKALADALDCTIETGASGPNTGHAVKARYKDLFGKHLEDFAPCISRPKRAS